METQICVVSDRADDIYIAPSQACGEVAMSSIIYLAANMQHHHLIKLICMCVFLQTIYTDQLSS